MRQKEGCWIRRIYLFFHRTVKPFKGRTRDRRDPAELWNFLFSKVTLALNRIRLAQRENLLVGRGALFKGPKWWPNCVWPFCALLGAFYPPSFSLSSFSFTFLHFPHFPSPNFVLPRLSAKTIQFAHFLSLSRVPSQFCGWRRKTKNIFGRRMTGQFGSICLNFIFHYFAFPFNVSNKTNFWTKKWAEMPKLNGDGNKTVGNGENWIWGENPKIGGWFGRNDKWKVDQNWKLFTESNERQKRKQLKQNNQTNIVVISKLIESVSDGGDPIASLPGAKWAEWREKCASDAAGHPKRANSCGFDQICGFLSPDHLISASSFPACPLSSLPMIASNGVIPSPFSSSERSMPFEYRNCRSIWAIKCIFWRSAQTIFRQLN